MDQYATTKKRLAFLKELKAFQTKHDMNNTTLCKLVGVVPSLLSSYYTQRYLPTSPTMKKFREAMEDYEYRIVEGSPPDEALSGVTKVKKIKKGPKKAALQIFSKEEKAALLICAWEMNKGITEFLEEFGIDEADKKKMRKALHKLTVNMLKTFHQARTTVGIEAW